MSVHIFIALLLFLLLGDYFRFGKLDCPAKQHRLKTSDYFHNELKIERRKEPEVSDKPILSNFFPPSNTRTARSALE